jgi:hypothetical protein
MLHRANWLDRELMDAHVADSIRIYRERGAV